MSIINTISNAFKETTAEVGTFGTIVVGILALALVALVLVIAAALNIWILNTLFGLALPYVWQTLLASLLVNLKLSYAGSASVNKVVEALQGKK